MNTHLDFSTKVTTIIALLFVIFWIANMLSVAWHMRHSPRFHKRHDRRGGWTLAGLAVGALGTMYSAKKGADATKAAAKAGQMAQVDPMEIADKARQQAKTNIAESLALEGQYAPGQQQFRNESMAALLAKLRGGTPYSNLAMQTTATEMGQPDQLAARSKLLQDAIDRASTNFALGGKLDTATRNEVTRGGITKAGQVGGGNLGLSNSIVGRDLGLKSMEIAQQRLNDAAQFGGYEQSMNAADLNAILAQRTRRAQLAQQLQGMEGNDLQMYGNLAGFGQGLTPPEAGLSPGDFAGLYVDNASNAATAGQNAAALKAQQARDNAAMFGQLGGSIGAAGSIWANRNKPKTPASGFGTGAGYNTDGTYTLAPYNVNA